MGSSAQHLDRLLPRHPASNRLSLTWNIRMKRVGFGKKQEVNGSAQIVDLSLEGALVEVYDEAALEVGERVKIRFNGHVGLAEIMHSREGSPGCTLYGVRIVRSLALQTAIDLAVGEIRGHSAELAHAWQRQH